MSLLIKGVTSFIKLTDTPDAYAGKPLKVARVKQTADGLEFADQVTQYELPQNITPDEATLEWSVQQNINVKRIYIVGKYMIVCMTTSSGRLRIYDVTNVENPELLSTLDYGYGYYDDVAISGKYLYIVSGSGDDLHIVDWSNPRSLNVVNSYGAIADYPQRCFVRGRYLYLLANYDKMFNIYDVSDPGHPVKVGYYTNATYLNSAYDFVISGNYAYIVGWEYMTVLNIADPTSPTYVTSWTKATGNDRGFLDIAGRYLYFCDGNSDLFRIYDVSNPASPSQVGTLGGMNYPFDCEIVGDWAFISVAWGQQLVVADLSDRASPSIRDTISLPTQGGALKVTGKFLFLGAWGNTAYTWIYSVWSIDIPAFVGNSVYAEYIYCTNIDVAEQIMARYGIYNGVAIPESLPKTLVIPLVLTQVTATDPGTAYAELSPLYRTNIDFSRLSVKQARVVVSAVGNEAGAGKGIQIYNSSDAAAICEVTWDGTAQQNGLAGSWTTCSTRAGKDIQVRVKGSSGTEDVTVDKVELQLLFE